MSYITKTVGKDMPDGEYIEVTAVERDNSRTLSPGFSITCLVWDSTPRLSGRERKRRGREADGGGAALSLIAQLFPELQPIIDVHLADQAGVPMYAKANGWYFYSGDASAYERLQVEKRNLTGYYAKMLETPDHERAARALHIPPADLPTGLDHEGFEAFVDSLTERYAADAQRAREVMAEMVDGMGVQR